MSDTGIKTEIQFTSPFLAKCKRIEDKAQFKIDNEVLKGIEKYVPKDTGALSNSAQTYSRLGSGELRWKTPYATAQYYSPRNAGSQTGAYRGPRWGERYKADNKRHIQAFVAKIYKE